MKWYYLICVRDTLKFPTNLCNRRPFPLLVESFSPHMYAKLVTMILSQEVSF